ncbi:hypothetical protein ABB37_03899 [Leptomonas pyrrhocoris]|uniref:Leucine-rich repeat protein n=1 Tax=Leptomonas pyrrhocoris TaxID=157538 RepID=A0A0M9G3E6_LEPPY|nr:hypothetical protein ABB37_03899 [Leptomonas pyrrhocoris]XP_015659995.1 hypothetical protein ABB37_03899 [Leptomonas pyrrhocoris]KPA81555.1 hypothetical protein ABB37_03899 [Leptomonas pyrrhocoris]KPA81556.1 hypothetical protein ABB37_03899 [Leptomonas pyrrhocoris]|eukprot:XP_015659994.1 hypothetical protein ABB37_03899 [Leptomonas pyrrhocoris]
MTNRTTSNPENGDSTAVVMTEKLIIEQCKKHDGYSTPELNERLYLHHFGFSRLTGLQAFTGCTVLYLSHNALSRLDGLAALTQLDSLYLSCNALTGLESLPSLPALRTLDVAENQITSINGVDNAAPQLQTLLAGRNRLARLTGLQRCTALLSLDLSHNVLEDEEKVDAGLRPLRQTLRTLLLQGNELCRSARHYRKRWIAAFPALKFLDEYPVFDEERERAVAFARGGTVAEEDARQAQKARVEAETETQFRYYGDFRDANRQARQRDGPTRTPTAYFLAHSTTRSTAPPAEEMEEEAEVYIPPTAASAAVHADPSGE